ncbi:hypothetical protein NP233_g1102 [Leucocoprinus birnbaumii]|uniref:Uncharacterized protein n=1 Tax=Leucocoprinus birnbaumii TaxID=56174 RepID=A0AAD5YW60_9AGAR|nr:hypothetical protein NP233_g1102 [Leucocoprinus birnbaumii]
MSTKPTSQDILNKLETIKVKIDAFSSTITAFRGLETPQQGILTYTRALELKGLLESTTADLNNVQKPVPREYGLQAVNISKEYRDTLKSLAPVVIAKANLFAALPVGSNLSMSLIAQMLKGMHTSVINTANAMIDNGPDDSEDLKEEGRAIRNEIDEMLKKIVFAYQ